MNAQVSPYYFRAIMGWWHVAHVRAEAVLQGAIEGVVLGLVFGVILGLATAWITRMRAPLRWTLNVLPHVFAAALSCWAAGGMIGVVFAASLPSTFRNSFIMVPPGRGQMLCYAWVGGSIWGAYAGTLIAAWWGCLKIRNWWKELARTRPGFAVIASAPDGENRI